MNYDVHALRRVQTKTLYECNVADGMYSIYSPEVGSEV